MAKPAKKLPKKPDPTSIRFSAAVLKALEKSADDAMRSRSAQAEWIISQWLKEQGLLR